MHFFKKIEFYEPGKTKKDEMGRIYTPHCAVAYWKSSYHSIYFLEISTLDSSSRYAPQRFSYGAWQDILFGHTVKSSHGWKRFESEAGGKYQLLLSTLYTHTHIGMQPLSHNQPWHYRAYGSSIQGHSSILMCDSSKSEAITLEPPSRDFIDIAFWHPSFQTFHR